MAALSNVNPNSYAVCWSDPVALLRYLVSLFGRVPLPRFLRPHVVGVNIEGCNAFP